MIKDKKFNEFDFYLKGIVDEKKQLAILSRKNKELNKLIKDVKWSDLKVEKEANNGNLKCYTVYLSSKISKKVANFEMRYKSFKHLEDIGREILYAGDELFMTCHIQISRLDQRIDIGNDGIPRSIRGLGLGCKIYRAILGYENYITSREDSLSSFGKILWNSIRKNSLFYTFYDKNNAICFALDRPPELIIQDLEKYFIYSKEILWDDDFVSENRLLLMESSIGHLL